MQALLKEILASIPKYVSNFYGVLTSPRLFVTQRDLDQPNALTEALAFAGISFSLSMVLQIPLLPGKQDFWQTFTIWLIIFFIGIVVAAAVVRLAWKIVGGQASFDKLLKVTAYHFGVGSPLIVLVLVCAAGVLKTFDRPLYNQLFAKTATQEPTVAIDSMALFAAGIIFLVGYILICVWFIVAWGAYRILNQAFLRQSLIAFFLASLIALPVSGLLIALGVNYLN